LIASSELAAVLQRSGVATDAPPWSVLASADDAGDDARQAAIGDIIASLADESNSTPIVRALCAEQLPEVRRIALELAARLPKLEPILVSWLRPLLRDRRLPREERTAAAAALLRTTGPRGRSAARVLRDFAAGFGRLRVLRRETELRRQFGNARAFDRLCSRLRRNIPLRCPRCGVQRGPNSMIRHLWRRHGKLLAHRRVVSPLWWLDDWAARAQPTAEPDDGLAHLSRQMLRRRLVSPEAASALRLIAARQKAALCPHCHAVVPLPADEYPEAASIPGLELSNDRLSGEGFVVARATRGLAARTRVTAPNGASRDWTVSGGLWHRNSAIRRLVAPWVVLALALASMLRPEWAILGTAIALCAAYLGRLIVRSRSAPQTKGSLVDAAWNHAVPALVDQPLTPGASRYLARLARTSMRLGSARARVGSLAHAERRANSALGDGVPAIHWSALLALRINDLGRLGEDPVPDFANALADVLRRGELAQLELLLAHGNWREWPAGRRTRLRIALLARAFDADMGVWELVEVGEAVPALGELLDSANVDGLARLRLLWSLGADKPWERCGAAATAFELAAFLPTEYELAAVPDVLLYQARVGGAQREAEPLWITGSGLAFRGVRLSAPGPIEVHLLPAGRGYELHFGAARFRFTDNPSHLAHSLSAWSNFLFGEFLPIVDGGVGIPDGGKLERLLRAKTLVCPECGGLFRGRSPAESS
jgi:hypothetical protein